MDIDFVILWDSSDFKDGSYKSWFKSIEEYAPWVHTVFFITDGSHPELPELKNRKIRLIKHEDFMPKEWIPTSSSNAIELNLHRIEDLSEHFVLFKADMCLKEKTGAENFFKNGLPRASALLSLYPSSHLAPESEIWLAPLTATDVINRNFKSRRTILKHWNKWFSLRYGKALFNNIYLMNIKGFIGFESPNKPDAILKSTIRKVWEAEEQLLSEVSSHRSNMPTDIDHLIFVYWQYVTGMFIPAKRRPV